MVRSLFLPVLIVLSFSLDSIVGLSALKSPRTMPTMTSSPPSFHCDRRSAIQSTIATSTVLLGGSVASSPAQAAYIDSATSPLKVTKRVYLDVQLASQEGVLPPQRIVIGLFGDAMPRTVENFVNLCSGANGGPSYAGTTFYRVLSDMTIQGGGIGDDLGKTGQSSFSNGAPFEPDNFNILHNRAGLVSMVRGVGGGVDSRFFVQTIDDGGWADDRYAAFGIVEEGMDFVHKIEKVDVKPPQNRPKTPVNIIASGVLPE